MNNFVSPKDVTPECIQSFNGVEYVLNACEIAEWAIQGKDNWPRIWDKHRSGHFQKV